LLCRITCTSVYGRFPPILNSNIQAIKRQLRALSASPQRKEPPRCLFSKSLGGLHSLDRHCGKVKDFLLLPGKEPRYPGYPARCILTTLWNGAYLVRILEHHISDYSWLYGILTGNVFSLLS